MIGFGFCSIFSFCLAPDIEHCAALFVVSHSASYGFLADGLARSNVRQRDILSEAYQPKIDAIESHTRRCLCRAATTASTAVQTYCLPSLPDSVLYWLPQQTPVQAPPSPMNEEGYSNCASKVKATNKLTVCFLITVPAKNAHAAFPC